MPGLKTLQCLWADVLTVYVSFSQSATLQHQSILAAVLTVQCIRAWVHEVMIERSIQARIAPILEGHPNQQITVGHVQVARVENPHFIEQALTEKPGVEDGRAFRCARQ